MSATPNDAMKDIMELVEAFGQSCKLAGVLEARGKDRTEANSAIFSTADAIRAAIGKLVSSTQPAMSQDAQPVACETERDCQWQPWCKDRCQKLTHPPIPQEGKVMEAPWISVDERMPDREERVLVYGAKRLRWAVAEWDEKDGWQTETCSEFFPIYPPTHWRSLPPPPVQGGLSTNNEEMK
jgi:hypothetical protein